MSKSRQVLLLVVLAGFSSVAQADVIGDMLKRVVEALRGDIAENISILAIILVILTTLFTRRLDWREAGIVMACIAAVYGVLELYTLATSG